MTEYFIMCRHWGDKIEDIGVLAHNKLSNTFAMYIDPSIVKRQELNPILFGVSQDLAVCDKSIKLWIEARTIPQDRENIEAIMTAYSIATYNEWELLKTTNGQNPGYDNWGFHDPDNLELLNKWKDGLVWQ